MAGCNFPPLVYCLCPKVGYNKLIEQTVNFNKPKRKEGGINFAARLTIVNLQPPQNSLTKEAHMAKKLA